MLFSATYACPTCVLRFARRERCPECGGTRVLSLRSEEERARFLRLTRRAREGEAGGEGASAFFQWIVALAALLRALASAFLPRLAAPVTARPAAAREPRTLRVVVAPASRAHAATLRGVVRGASVTLESPIAGAPCIAFGLHGQAGGAQVDDAEGGDFDLELESGERVMVSLEHAVLVDDAHDAHDAHERPEPPVAERTPYLDELLGERGIELGEGAEVRAVELLVRDGDVVTIDAELSGGAALSFGERAPSRVRVASGDEANPLRVRVRVRGA